jgi:hypothetical protein
MESHLKQPVFGIVTLAASGANQVAAPGGALAVVILGDREGRAAAAGDQEHAKVRLGFLRGRAFDMGLHDADDGAAEAALLTLPLLVRSRAA